MKLPAFQFYPADWRKDPGVQALSFHDRGIWFEILCLMHESAERGKLTLRGQPMPEDALARLLGLDKQNLTKTLTTLIEYGVASVDPDSGALVCRRMVRDEDLREKRREAGKMGGNPTLLKKRVKNLVKQNPTPSSSSSTSSSEKNKRRGTMEEIKAFAQSTGMPESDGESCFHKWEGNGWMNGGHPIKDWKATFRNWKSQGFLPSQKKPQVDLFGKPAKTYSHANGYNESTSLDHL